MKLTRHSVRKQYAGSRGPRWKSSLEKNIGTFLTETFPKRFRYEEASFLVRIPVMGTVCSNCGTPATAARRYTPDFTAVGTGIHIESKGQFHSKDRTKLIAFKEQYPTETLILYFQANNWLTSKHKQRYADWAKEHGFLFAVNNTVELERILTTQLTKLIG